MAVNNESEQDVTNKIVKDIEKWIKDSFTSVKTYFKDKNPMDYIKAEALSLFVETWDVSFLAPVALVIFISFALVYQIAWKVSSPSTHVHLDYHSLTHGVSPISSPPKYDIAFEHSVEEGLNKLFTLHSSGDIEAFENELFPVMQEYCVMQLGKGYLDGGGIELMQINLAESITFIAEGNYFTEHTALTVTPAGGIVDPFDFDSNPRGSKACPLVDALFKKGQKRTFSKVAKSGEEDGDCRVDKKFDFQFISNFLDVATQYLTAPDVSPGSKCHVIMETFRRETVRSLLINWAEMVDIISRETKKQFPEGVDQGKLEAFDPDPESPDYKKFVIGRDGSIIQTGHYGEIDGRYLWCQGIESLFNTKFVLLDGYTYTNIKIGIDETFHQWYEDTLDKMQIAEP